MANNKPLKNFMPNLIRWGSTAAQSAGKTVEVMERILNKDTINPNLIKAQYAVRGELAIRAEELKDELRANPKAHPFDKIVFCNIGNPQQLGQKPLTFFRQTLSLMEWPEILNDHPQSLSVYPKDVIEKARELLESIGTIGAYSHSQGIPAIREQVTRFIEKRDGYPTKTTNIFMTNGASDGIARILECIITSDKIGVMIPIPQYPLYSAAINLLGGAIVPYYLNEENDWSLRVPKYSICGVNHVCQSSELERAYNSAKVNDIEVRALCIINPGNPTGNIFSREILEEIIVFCKKNRLVLLADEVYQMNVYGCRPFLSARRIAMEMGIDVEIFSFHSVSKGLIGECGHRGGYMECHNIDSFVIEQLYKLASIRLCANIPGQIMVGLMVNPPKEGDPSFDLYNREMHEIHAMLKRRGLRLQKAFASMTDVTCNDAQGAMYLFPRFNFPQKLVEYARLLGKLPDEVYAMDLLNATGICIVPGSGFGQAPGTFHIRTTFLPPENYFDAFISQWRQFHESFITKWK